MVENGKAKILIVEDSLELLHVWEALFATSGKYELVTADTGCKAIEIVRKGFNPDILITDYYLGDYTGLELVNEISAIWKLFNTIIITGNDEDIHLKNLFRAGKIDLLIKPVKFRELLKIIDLRLNHIAQRQHFSPTTVGSEL